MDRKEYQNLITKGKDELDRFSFYKNPRFSHALEDFYGDIVSLHYEVIRDGENKETCFEPNFEMDTFVVWEKISVESDDDWHFEGEYKLN